MPKKWTVDFSEVRYPRATVNGGRFPSNVCYCEKLRAERLSEGVSAERVAEVPSKCRSDACFDVVDNKGDASWATPDFEDVGVMIMFLSIGVGVGEVAYGSPDYQAYMQEILAQADKEIHFQKTYAPILQSRAYQAWKEARDAEIWLPDPDALPADRGPEPEPERPFDEALCDRVSAELHDIVRKRGWRG